MEVIKTSARVLCLSSPFRSYRILQDSKSECVARCWKLGDESAAEGHLHKRKQNSTDPPGESALLRAPFWPCLGVTGS